MTQTLITSICADAQAQLDADPNATIRRLKQDLRAARQAATKARNYAERVRDGIVTPEVESLIAEREDAATQALLMERNAALAKIAELNAVIARRDETIRTGRAAFAKATRRAVNAERERDALDAEIAALRASRGDLAAEEVPHSIFDLIFPELMRSCQLIRRFFSESDGANAAVGNEMLREIAKMNESVAPRKRPGRKAA